MTELVFNNIGDSIPASYHAIDAAMASFCRFYSWLLTDTLPLTSIHLTRQSTQNLKAYLSYFKCKVRLDQPNNSLWLQNDALNRPLPTADKAVADLHRIALSNMAKARLHGDFQQTVADVMRNTITQDNFGMALIASKLFISQSTLQRRLREEQLTFQQLLDKTREHLAIALLRQTRLSENQISEQLGFASASGFSRAFKKWTGKLPKTYRI
jgi:AraC-like DNA-binding protein